MPRVSLLRNLQPVIKCGYHQQHPANMHHASMEEHALNSTEGTNVLARKGGQATSVKVHVALA